MAEQVPGAGSPVLHSVVYKQLCLILLNKPDELSYFLDESPVTEAEEACWVLNGIVNKQKPVSDHAIQKVLEADLGVTIAPWQLFITAQCGEVEKGVAFLKEMVERKIGQYVNFKNAPLLKPLRNNPMFQELVTTTLAIISKTKNLYPLKTNSTKILLSEEEVQLRLNQLNQLMEKEHVYLDTAMNLRKMALELSLHPNKLSWLLNKHHQKNFNEYINTYRLEAFLEKAVSQDYKHLTLLGLAYECGFNSKSVFNEFFQKVNRNDSTCLAESSIHLIFQ